MSKENSVVIENAELPDSDPSKNIPISPQNNTNPPVDVLFVQEISDFTLAADTGKSGVDVGTLIYTFTATAGHGLVAGNEIILLDTVADRYFQAVVVSELSNVITIDRPIDHNFATASTLGKKTNSNMNVDGSSTPVRFTVRGGATPIEYTRIIITIVDDAAMDDDKFGSLTKLTRGLVVRLVNGYQETIFNFKTNGEIKQFAFDGAYVTGTFGPSGQNSFSSRITWNGPEKHDTSIKLSAGEELQVLVQDNLTALTKVTVSAMGRKSKEVQV